MNLGLRLTNVRASWQRMDIELVSAADESKGEWGLQNIK